MQVPHTHSMPSASRSSYIIFVMVIIIVIIYMQVPHAGALHAWALFALHSYGL
jgi:hypothetical protein